MMIFAPPKIGVYGGCLNFDGLSQVESNRLRIRDYLAQGISYYIFEVKATEPQDAIDHWGMLDEEGFEAEVRMDSGNWSDPNLLDQYSFINQLSAQVVFFGHEVYEDMISAQRQARKDLYLSKFPGKRMRPYFGGDLWLPHRKINKTHGSTTYRDYLLGQETEADEGTQYIVHWSLGKWNDNDDTKHLRNQFRLDNYWIDQLSPQGHPKAVHFNIDVGYPGPVDDLALLMKGLVWDGASYVYLRCTDSSGNKVDATPLMLQAINQAATDLGL